MDVFSIFKENKYYSFSDLKKYCHVKNDLQQKKLIDELYHLELKGLIYGDVKGYIKVPREFYLVHGVLAFSNKKNFYIKKKDGSYILLAKKNLKNAQVSDTVFVEVFPFSKKNKGVCYGKVKRVVKPLETPQKVFFFQEVLQKDKNELHYFVSYQGKKYFFAKNSLNGAFPGDVVSVRLQNSVPKILNIIKRDRTEHIFEYRKGTWIPIGTEPFPVKLKTSKTFFEQDQILASVSLQKENDMYTIQYLQTIQTKSPFESLAREYGFDIDFTNGYDFKQIDFAVLNSTHRRDLRNLVTFTIDPKGAKDLDDAVSLMQIENHYRLFVHIADVDAYVAYQSPLYYESLKRGFSCYPANQVIPLFPKVLSNQLCSLNPEGDKLTKTIQIDVNEDGEIIDFDIYKSIIHSNKQMNYDDVNAVLEKGELLSDYLPYLSDLQNMKKLSHLLQQRRKKFGYTSFVTIERKFVFDEEDHPIELTDVKHDTAQKMIENFMLLANETIANYSYWMNVPFIYRNHEGPEVKEIYALQNKLKAYTNDFKKVQNIANPFILQKYVSSLYQGKTEEEKNFISNLIISSMKRAYYDDVSKGHFMLGLERYATFTSPIRKVSDFINHQIIGNILSGDISSEMMDDYRKNLHSLCVTFTQKEQLQEQLETDVFEQDFKYYVQNWFQQVLDAHIIFMMEHLFVVKTDQNIIGNVLLDQRFTYHKSTGVMSDIYGNTYQIGDVIPVQMLDFLYNHQEILFTFEEKRFQKKLKKEKLRKEMK